MEPVAAIDIGTTKIVAMVGEKREDGSIMITGVGHVPSVGVRKGQIIDLGNVTVCVKSALEMAEQTSNVNLGSVYVSVSGGHIRGKLNSGSIPILDAEGGVSEEDIDEVGEIARAVNIPDDRQIIHTIHRRFSVDDQEQVVNPCGMLGSRLSLEMLVLHGSSSQLKNTSRVLEQLQLDVEDAAFSGLCSALAVLTPEWKKRGAVVIDLGGGTTDYMAYVDGVAACGGALGVGGDHVTNDIAIAFNMPTKQAERLKKERGSAIVEQVAEPSKILLPAEVGFPETTVHVRSMQIVINARMKETFEMLKGRLEKAGVLSKLGAGVLLTGGGAHLRGVAKLAEQVFGVPCSIGTPRGVTGIATETNGPEQSACCGLVQYGFRVQRESESERGSLLGSFVRTLLGTR